MSKSLLPLVLVFLGTIAAPPIHSSEGQFYFESRIETGELPPRGGLIHCEIIVVPNWDLADITIELLEADSLDYLGLDQFNCSGKAGDTCRHSFDVIIPDSTLSGIQFVVRSGRVRKFCSKYFAPVNDRVVVFPGNPRTNSFYHNPYLPEKKQEIFTPEDRYGPYTVPTETVYIPDDDGRKGMPASRPMRPGYDTAPLITEIIDTTGLVEFAGAEPDPRDTSMYLLIQGASVVARMPKKLFRDYYVPPKTDRELKERLERKPLDYTDVEGIMVDDTVFQRKRGETRFTPWSISSENRILNLEPPVARDPTAVDTVVMDLREPDHMAYVREHAELLLEMEVEGFYKVVTTRAQISEFVKRRINGFTMFHWENMQKKSKSGPESRQPAQDEKESP